MVEQLSDQCPSRWALAQALSLFLRLLSLCCKIHNRCVSSQRRWMLGFVLPFRQGLLIPPPPINFRLSSRFLLVLTSEHLWVTPLGPGREPRREIKALRARLQAAHKHVWEASLPRRLGFYFQDYDGLKFQHLFLRFNIPLNSFLVA